ncbi:unnamed protein product, partial [Medioppia subpectinata]
MFFEPMPEIFLNGYKRYGNIYGTFLGTKPNLMICDPQLIKDMNIKDFHVFFDHNDFITGDPLNDRSLFNLLGDDWKKMRSIISPTFSSGKMRAMHPIIVDCVHRLEDYLEKKSKNGEDVELKKAMGNLTMDVIASCAFGTKTDTHNDDNNEFVINARKVFRGNWRVWVFFLVYTTFPKLIEWTGFQITDPGVQNFFQKAVRIKSIIERRKSEKTKKRDYLQLMIDAKNKTLETGDELEVDDLNTAIFGEVGEVDQLDKNKSNKLKATEITDIDILATSFLFFVAGYETTASLLTHLLYSLALNPECQQKLYEEVHSFDGNYDYESISKMPYLEACVAETLRIYNPVAGVSRIANEEYTIGDTGITIPKGMLVNFNIEALHKNPEYYPNPDRWDPERFMPENRDQLVPYTYMPFGMGPRNCVGMRFALMEAKTTAAYLVNKFKFVRTDRTTVPLKPLKFQFIYSTGDVNVGVDYLTRNFKYWSSRGIDGPKPIVGFGTLYQIFFKPLTELNTENFRKYGKIYGTFLGTKPVLMIADPELTKEMNIKDFHLFVNRNDFVTGDSLNDRSMFNLMDDEWKNMRSIISPTFSSGKMKAMHPIIVDCTQRLEEYLEKKAVTGEEVEMK